MIRKKKCTGTCGKSLIVSTENYHRSRNNLDGHCNRCKLCSKEISDRHRRKRNKMKDQYCGVDFDWAGSGGGLYC